MTHPTDAMVEKVARALAPLAWAALGLADTLAHQNRRKASLNHARAAVAAYEAALNEAGLVVVPRQATDEMAFAGAKALVHEMQAPSATLMAFGYSAMIAAASPAPKDTKEGE